MLTRALVRVAPYHELVGMVRVFSDIQYRVKHRVGRVLRLLAVRALQFTDASEMRA